MDKFKNLIVSVEKHSPKRYSIILILPIFTLVAGFLVWSVYLYSLGFIVNDLIRTRFILTGILFIVITFFVYVLTKILLRLLKIVVKKVGDSAFIFLSLIWLLIYSVLLFPKLPFVIGGGQPKALALVTTRDGLELLRSFNFDVPEGAEYQTGNICLAYEGIEDLIILRDDRVMSLDKSLIHGFVSLPGPNATNEQDCISYASQWSRKGLLSSFILSISTIYNSFASFLNLPKLRFNIP